MLRRLRVFLQDKRKVIYHLPNEGRCIECIEKARKLVAHDLECLEVVNTLGVNVVTHLDLVILGISLVEIYDVESSPVFLLAV